MAFSEVMGGLAALMRTAKAMGNIEVQQQVIELQEKVLGLQQDVEAKEREIRVLKDNEAIHATLAKREDCYWRDGHDKPGPFCTGCWDNNRKLIHMVERGTVRLCPICKNVVRDPGKNELVPDVAARPPSQWQRDNDWLLGR